MNTEIYAATPEQLTESAVLALMAQQHKIAITQAEKLWQELKTTEAAMAPFKTVYEAALDRWSVAQRQAAALEFVLRAKGVPNAAGGTMS